MGRIDFFKENISNRRLAMHNIKIDNKSGQLVFARNSRLKGLFVMC